MTGAGGLSRRHLIVGAGALGAAGLSGAVAEAVGAERVTQAHAIAPRRTAFHGRHQAGIATPVQGHLLFASFDVTATDQQALARLLYDWTEAARSMTAGRAVGGGVAVSRLAPPPDTGEAVGLDAANLTLTVGFGSSLFSRFGLGGDCPEALADLPPFPGDSLVPAQCGGDLAVQACADDPQVAVHAVRNLSRIASGRAAIRWAQRGFGKAPSTEGTSPTPRNLFGFKDGTANIVGTDTTALDEHVWAQVSDGPGWMAGGSYLVARRIRMTIETWDRTSLDEQERIFGRSKDVGAPLGRAGERDPVLPSTLAATSHVRLAHPTRHSGARLLRRGFNFVDGYDALGHLDAGLFFLAYQRDPRRQFVPIQTELARHDALNEYVRHTGSALFAIPPGVEPDGWWGQTLFE